MDKNLMVSKYKKSASMQINQTRKRIEWIDVLRGIAIISVMLGHCGIDAISPYVYIFHLPVFFMISGLFWKNNHAMAIDSFIINKIKSLILPYYMACIPLLVLFPLLHFYRSGAIGLANGFKDIFLGMLYASGTKMIHPDSIMSIGGIWFLWALFWCEVFLKILERFNKKVIWVVSLVIAVCSALTSKIFWLPLSIQSGAFALPYLIAGNQMKFLIANDKIKKWIVCLIAVFSSIGYIAMVIFYEGTYMVNAGYAHGAADYIGTFICVGFVGAISMLIAKIPVLSNILQWYGRNSLLFLAVHNIELTVFPYSAIFNKIFHAAGLEDISIVYQNIALILAKLIIITVLMYVLMKNKKIRVLFRCS